MAYDPGTERIVLAGGVGIFGNTPVYYEDTWTFDPATVEWTELTTEAAPPGRAHGALVFSPLDARLLLFGGDGIGSADDDRLWAFDSATSVWEDLGAGGPGARWLAAITIDIESGALLVAGGEGDTSEQLSENVSTRSIGLLSDVWLRDPTLGWVEQTPLEEPIGFVAAAGGSDGVIVIGSGHINRYIAAADRWEEIARAR